MKLTKLFAAVLLVTTVALVSCKSKSAKDLIVNKWKISNVSGGEAGKMSDSIKTEIYSKATMEFMKDGKYMMSMMGEPGKGGTYSVSDDGKTLTTTDEGSTNPEAADIVEISKDKCVIKNKKEDMTITLVSK